MLVRFSAAGVVWI